MAIDTTRISSWNGYIGQEQLKKRLRIQIDAAVEQVRTLDHLLLAAPPGYGKTSLAKIIADELGARFEPKQIPLSEKAIVSTIQECDSYGEYCVLFLDEIHNASRKEHEFLNPLLEFGFVQDRRGHRYEVANLTVIAATTEADKVPKPLYDRFQVPSFDAYTDEEMTRIILGMAKMLNLAVSEEVATELAKATGGTPRHARRFVLAIRDLDSKFGRIPTSEEVLDFCRIDADGLTHDHYTYLKTLHLLGGTTGLQNIRSVMRLPDSAVRELELLLLRQDLIGLTPSGRELLPPGARKISIRRKEHTRD